VHVRIGFPVVNSDTCCTSHMKKICDWKTEKLAFLQLIISCACPILVLPPDDAEIDQLNSLIRRCNKSMELNEFVEKMKKIVENKLQGITFEFEEK
jgi:hypothetical protein